jgi:hypothetical protein
MAQPEKQPEVQPYRAKWGDTSNTPLVVGDLLHWRTTADRCVLTVGQIDLPVIDGPIPPGAEVDIKPVVRIMLTPETLKIWALIVNQAAEQFVPAATKK